jgi:peptide/nickel transport system ATP-binding protein
MSSAPVLDITHLTILRDRVPILTDLSWRVMPGEHWALLGGNGSGKTSLLSALAGYLMPTTGDIALLGEQYGQADWRELRMKLGIVSSSVRQMMNDTEPALDTVVSGRYAIIDYWGTPKRADAARARELMESVEIGHLAKRPWAVLSQGERQRVLIALALACDPHLLIADEPTTALDVMVQAQVLALLAELQRERAMAMLFITHDLSVLTATCRRLAVMYAGRIIEEGPSDEVFVAPEHPYTRALAAAFPTIGDRSSRMRPRGVAGDPPDPAAVPSGCPFHPRCDRVVDGCDSTDVMLRPAGDGRRAACIHAGGGDG